MMLKVEKFVEPGSLAEDSESLSDTESHGEAKEGGDEGGKESGKEADEDDEGGKESGTDPPKTDSEAASATMTEEKEGGEAAAKEDSDEKLPAKIPPKVTSQSLWEAHESPQDRSHFHLTKASEVHHWRLQKELMRTFEGNINMNQSAHFWMEHERGRYLYDMGMVLGEDLNDHGDGVRMSAKDVIQKAYTNESVAAANTLQMFCQAGEEEKRRRTCRSGKK
jgi:hypothetical protein